jgi:hypothetical protein
MHVVGLLVMPGSAAYLAALIQLPVLLQWYIYSHNVSTCHAEHATAYKMPTPCWGLQVAALHAAAPWECCSLPAVGLPAVVTSQGVCLCRLPTAAQAALVLAGQCCNTLISTQSA